jgi:F-type H+-transporting ATPase subunit b
MWNRLFLGMVVGIVAAGGLSSKRAEASTESKIDAEMSRDDTAAQKSAKIESEEAGGEKLNPMTFKGFNFPGDLSLWTGVVFLVVMLILGKFAWKPIADGLAKREKQIADQIAEALRRNEEARELLAQHQKKLDASHNEVRGILDQGRRDAEELSRQLLEKARADADGERKRALQEIDAATSGALKDLADRSAKLAVDLAGKIVGQRLKPQDHDRLIQDAVNGFSGNGTKKKP